MSMRLVRTLTFAAAATAAVPSLAATTIEDGPCRFAVPFEANVVPKSGALGERFFYNLNPIIAKHPSLSAATMFAQAHANDTNLEIGISCGNPQRGQFKFYTVGPGATQ